MDRGKELVIDIPPDLEPAQWPGCCIYRVPKKLRRLNKYAYTPKLISIGPFHHGNEDLRGMEMQKMRYFKDFCSKYNKSPEDLASIVAEKELQIRHSYAEAPKQAKNQFVKMILLDAIFIIELFCRGDAKDRENDEYILSQPWLKDDVTQDLILLENQLPFFILDLLFQHLSGTPNSFLKLACNFFFSSQKECHKKEVKHFTDLQRYFYCSPKLKSSDGTIEDLYSATKLHRAGLNFKEWKEKPLEDRCLLDIQIKKPKLMQTTLVIPQFVINHGTEPIFRNIMALEQCHYPFQAYICNYIVLLNFLIVTSDDAELLVDKKIIVHSLVSNEEVVKTVNGLGKEIMEKNSCYLQVAKNLKEHSEYWWNKYIVSFRTDIFRDIWRGTTTFFGIMVMLATIGSFLTPFVYHK